MNLIAVTPDAATYLVPARNLLVTQSFSNLFNQPEVSRTPGYPVFIAGLMYFVGDNLRKVLIAQAFILSAEVVALYWFARRIILPTSAFIAGLIAAFSPWGIVLAGLPLTEGLFLLLLSLIFLSMKITTEGQSKLHVCIGAGLVGLLTAATVLVRPIWPLIPIVVGAFSFLYGLRRERAYLLVSIVLIFSLMPVWLWKTRNERVAQFSGLSNIAGQCAWQMLASRVIARTSNEDRWELQRSARLEENRWKLPLQREDEERWRRAGAIFAAHPVFTGYYFLLAGAEHALHPSPDVLSPARLNFQGDYWVLGGLWLGLIAFGGIGWLYCRNLALTSESTAHQWLTATLFICVLLTLSSGLCFGGGSRYRAPLELAIPLLAACGIAQVSGRRSRPCASEGKRLARYDVRG